MSQVVGEKSPGPQAAPTDGVPTSSLPPFFIHGPHRPPQRAPLQWKPYSYHLRDNSGALAGTLKVHWLCPHQPLSQLPASYLMQ